MDTRSDGRVAAMGRHLSPLPPSLRRAADEQHGFVTVRQCAAAGVDFRARQRRLISAVWREPVSGVFDVEPAVERDIPAAERRAVELALIAAGEGSAAVGLAALRLHGCWSLPRTWTARAVRASRRRGKGGGQNDGFSITTAQGRRAATVAWAIVHALPHLDRLHLIGVLDWALHEGHIASVNQVVTLGARHRGIGKVREWGPLADGRAESFLETWARVQCIDAGLPPTTLQLPLRDIDGNVRARGDLAWQLPDGRWLVVEIDGASIHDAPGSVRRDRRRQNWMVGEQVVVLRYDVTDLRQGLLPAEIRWTIRRLSAGAA